MARPFSAGRRSGPPTTTRSRWAECALSFPLGACDANRCPASPSTASLETVGERWSWRSRRPGALGRARLSRCVFHPVPRHRPCTTCMRWSPSPTVTSCSSGTPSPRRPTPSASSMSWRAGPTSGLPKAVENDLCPRPKAGNASVPAPQREGTPPSFATPLSYWPMHRLRHPDVDPRRPESAISSDAVSTGRCPERTARVAGAPLRVAPNAGSELYRPVGRARVVGRGVLRPEEKGLLDRGLPRSAPARRSLPLTVTARFRQPTSPVTSRQRCALSRHVSRTPQERTALQPRACTSTRVDGLKETLRCSSSAVPMVRRSPSFLSRTSETPSLAIPRPRRGASSRRGHPRHSQEA